MAANIVFSEAALADFGGFEGVLGADGVGTSGSAADPAPRFSLISPYSFHSSTWSRSYAQVKSWKVVDIERT